MIVEIFQLSFHVLVFASGLGIMFQINMHLCIGSTLCVCVCVCVCMHACVCTLRYENVFEDCAP